MQLEFEVPVTMASGVQHIVRSRLTHPMLVYSHQKQWQGALRLTRLARANSNLHRSASFWIVFLHFAFGSGKGASTASQSATWPAFVNAFQELMVPMCVLTTPRTHGPRAVLATAVGAGEQQARRGPFVRRGTFAETLTDAFCSSTDWDFISAKCFERSRTVSLPSSGLDEFNAFVSPFLFSLCFR